MSSPMLGRLLTSQQRMPDMPKPQSQERQVALTEPGPYVIKAKEAIHVANEMTLLQRQSWNHLLYHAYDHLLDRDEHSISVAELMRRLGIQTRNVDHLKQTLEGIGQNVLKWDVLGADGDSDWGFYTLLSRVRIHRGIVTYAFDTDLRAKLNNPRIYARISLAIQNRFSSKHALALYEICVHWTRRESGSGETPWIPVATFRELMGLADGVYPEFKKLNKWVIKDPLEEINRLTDLRVEAGYKRQKRRVTAVKFRIRNRTELPQALQTADQDAPQPSRHAQLVQELVDAGLPESEAVIVVQKDWDYVTSRRANGRSDFAAYVREKIALLAAQPKSKIRNRPGFLIEAIRGDYTQSADAEKPEGPRARSGNQWKDDERKNQLRGEWDEAAHEICKQILHEEPSAFGATIDGLFTEAPFARSYVKARTTPRDAYDSGGALTAMVDSRLREQYPERFQALNEQYQQRLEELNT